MTLGEAIAHSTERGRGHDCACAAEHRQLAEWLCELKMLREAIKPIVEVDNDFRIYAAILRHETDKLFALQEAVRKAKEIMDGGDKMSDKQETMADIVSQMRRNEDVYWNNFADRIEAAYRRDEETTRIAMQSAQARFDEAMNGLMAENDKLREALKPIMEFRVAPAKWLDTDEMYHKAFDAVRKAQAIMKGEKK